MRFYRSLCALLYRKELTQGEPSYLVRFVVILGTIGFIILIAYFHDPVSQNRYSPISKILAPAPDPDGAVHPRLRSPEQQGVGPFITPAATCAATTTQYLRCSLLLL